MKIAFFSESYKPYLSGVTNSIETLKSGLESLGHGVMVFSPSYPGSKQIENVYRFPSLPAPYPGYRITIPVPGKYFSLIKENKIDIIHSHSPYQLGLLSMSYARKMKVPFIFTMHTMLSKYMHYVPLVPEKIITGISDKYSRWFCNRCDIVVVPTSKVMDQLRSIGIKVRIEVAPTGVDITLADKASPSGIREKHSIPKDTKVLLFVGRLAKEKNLDFLFKAFEIIQGREKNAYLLIVAGGPLEKEYRSRGMKNVIFAGQIQYPKVLDYYKASDLFVFSSLSETQGLVLAEAMSCGIPQVAVDAEGVSDVVRNGETGYLTALDTDIFADKVLKILNDNDLWAKFSRTSRETALHMYSKEVFAKKIESIYKSVI